MKTLRYIYVCLLGLSFQPLFAIAQTPTTGEENTRSENAVNRIDAQNESDGVLRLQDTIRGNKEQPQVLSIVPWQLPTHKRIDATAEWQPILDKMAPLERGQFLRELQLLGAENIADTVASESNSTSNSRSDHTGNE